MTMKHLFSTIFNSLKHIESDGCTYFRRNRPGYDSHDVFVVNNEDCSWGGTSCSDKTLVIF